MEINNILNWLFERLAGYREERPSAGTKFRLMGVAADIVEVTETLQREVLDVVSHEAVLDADVDTDYAILSEQVLTMELEEKADADDAIREQTHLVNEALGVLSNMLGQIDGQLKRHHKDEEYERLYEGERRRYMNSGSPGRARQKFEEWKDIEDGHPQQEQVTDFLVEKLLHMFEKGALTAGVEHIQRAKRYPSEVDFEQVEISQKITKSVYHHYAALRKIVDYKDGCLVVDPVRVGRYFYLNRHEENAKSHRSAFLNYMYKIELLQAEYRKLMADHDDVEESNPLPDVLATGVAMKYWQRLQAAGLVDEHCQQLPDTTRKQAMYIADMFSDKLQMRSKWKPFQDLWHINNLAQEKWDMQETGKSPARSQEIDKIFME